jgi:hypothetical protein
LGKMNALTSAFQPGSNQNEVYHYKGPIGDPETGSRSGFVTHSRQAAGQIAAQPGAASLGHSRSGACRVGIEHDAAAQEAALAPGPWRQTAESA